MTQNALFTIRIRKIYSKISSTLSKTSQNTPSRLNDKPYDDGEMDFPLISQSKKPAKKFKNELDVGDELGMIKAQAKRLEKLVKTYIELLWIESRREGDWTRKQGDEIQQQHTINSNSNTKPLVLIPARAGLP